MGMKRDGHTHSYFCLHGSGEETEKFVIRAIELGFVSYSITEHLPLPDNLLRETPYSPEFKKSLEIREGMDSYIRELEGLKKKYRDKIQLQIGVEMDYIPGQEDYSRYLLKEYGSYFDDGLLSVHMIRGVGGWRCVDYSPQDFKDGLIMMYGGYEEAQLAYYDTVLEAIKADLGQYKPKRIGHLCLCNKFQRVLNTEGITSEKVYEKVRKLITYAGQQGYSLDANVAGLYKKDCQEIYTPSWVIEIAKKAKVELVYGSDAHAVSEVGRSYDHYLSLM